MAGERDLATLAKARRELEELYMGVPDESVNLTFGYLAEVKQHAVMVPPEKKKQSSSSSPIDPIQVSSNNSSLNKLPSLDFNRAMQQAASNNSPRNFIKQQHHHLYVHHGDTADSSMEHHHHHGNIEEEALHGSRGHRSYVNGYESSSHVVVSPKRHTHIDGFKHGVDQHSMAYDHDVSGISTTSMSSYPERGGRRRPGIPHSNICTICSTYIYIFRHRCLVCGRVYCRSCVSVGMGEMTEGRKCVECLGRRFSQRYIQRAGKIGCCARYPSMVKQQELKWAEKGPRRSGERGYNKSVMMSRSRSPITPRTPTRAHVANSPSSFVMNSTYSAYSPTRSPIPF